MIENATPLDHPLEIEPVIPPLTRTLLLKLGCTITDKTYHSLVQFPQGTLWKMTYTVSNTHYKVMLPDGIVIGAEYSRWLGLNGLYMIKIPVELVERDETSPPPLRTYRLALLSIPLLHVILQLHYDYLHQCSMRCLVWLKRMATRQ